PLQAGAGGLDLARRASGGRPCGAADCFGGRPPRPSARPVRDRRVGAPPALRRDPQRLGRRHLRRDRSARDREGVERSEVENHMLLALLLAVDAALQPFVKVEAAALALEHVRVIDGTGAPPREDQTLFIAGGKVVAQAPAGAQRIDLTGRTVMPGLVGMHDHLFYPMGGAMFGEMAYSFPRLYLAAGVTTIRTAGSVEPYTDL